VTEELTEQKKYERMWAHPQYRQVAPGEDCAMTFLTQARPRPGSEVIDFGSGTGRGAIALALFGKLKVRMLDFAENCLDEEVRQALTTQAHALSFVQHDLCQPIAFTAEYGYCTDVLEHIPTEDVSKVLGNILQAAQHVFFQISCTDDSCGTLIGHPLHLTVKPMQWWLEQLQKFDFNVHWSQDYGTHCMIYGTAWISGRDVVDVGVLNTSEEFAKANVRENLKAEWNEVGPYMASPKEVMILGGGPSLNGHLGEITRMRAEGKLLVTLNGTYNWALANGLRPSATVVVDARELNKRFTKPVVDDCRYLISSLCHPSVLEGLPRERTFLWHSTWSELREIIDKERALWFGIPGGSTVMLRAIPLLRLLGFSKFHLFGFDSCLYSDGKANFHHAYPQVENDNVPAFPVVVGGRQFLCHPWMFSQAQEFMDLVKVLGNEIELEVYGDGLIAHILKTGASMADLELNTGLDHFDVN